MKIHTCFITYNRLEATKRAIESYLETVSVPFTMIVVDNCSTDGTVEWVQEEFPWGAWERNEDGSQQSYYWLSPENLYPGKACNEGWSMLEYWHADFLHRADNDFAFREGWCEEVMERFEENPRLGQLGLMLPEEEGFNTNNTGGNCVIRRELWDAGLRWDERPWPVIAETDPGWTEDSFFSPAVKAMGWEWGRVQRKVIDGLTDTDPDDRYYRTTYKDRRITHVLNRLREQQKT